MTQIEAIQLMTKGVKVTHEYFTPDEWITYKDGRLIDESGCIMNIHEFFSIRNVKSFSEGWSIWEKKKQS